MGVTHKMQHIQVKLERTQQSRKEPIEVGKFKLKLESSGRSWKVTFGSSQSILSNFFRFFLTPLGSFQLQRIFPTALSNYTYPVSKLTFTGFLKSPKPVRFFRSFRFIFRIEFEKTSFHIIRLLDSLNQSN